ncbi:hypothetical protein [Streptomyces sp. NPDC018610]|uniref:hypothetical protein n=1 Tax=Streptomyces sp. NPDC018610 TaxID=3365049 RepID=UPI0037908D01
MPDQQAQGGEDPWEAADRTAGPGGSRSEPGADEDATPGGEDVPGTDEAGSGPRGAPRSGSAYPEEQPVPEEPSG